MKWNVEAKLMKAVAKITMNSSNTKSGAILAMMISDVVAGDITSCSIVPASRSFTMAVLGDNGAVQDNQQTQDSSDHKPAIDEPRIKKERSRLTTACPRRLTATALTCAKRTCNPLPGSPSSQVLITPCA